jgi:hypothetical protein
MYFTPGTCSSRLRTPLIASTLWLSNSTCINQPRHQIHALSARLMILIFVSVELLTLYFSKWISPQTVAPESRQCCRAVR